MLQGLERIAFLLRIYKIRVNVYLDKQSADSSTENLDFEAAIIKLYTHILGFQARLVAHLGKSSLQRAALGTFQADDWNSWLDEIEKDDAECLLFTNLIDKERERRDWDKQYLQGEDQVRIQRNILEALNTTQRQLEADRYEDRRGKLLQSLSTNYEEQKDFNPKRVPGTCEWFLRSPQFSDWRNAPGSRILWVSAGPGCGKSVLSRCLIDERHVSTSVMASTICYFFFKEGQEGRQTGADALKAITHQLLRQHPSSNLIHYALPRYTAHGDKLGSMFGELWKNLLETLKDPATGEVVCVLDALDECTESEREKLLDHLIELYSSNDYLSNPNVKLKILTASRQYHDIESRFRALQGAAAFIQLDGDDKSDEISREIGLVIDHEVPRVASTLNEDDQEKVAQHLRSIGNRTYLWLYLMLDVIKKKIPGHGTEKGLARVISELPNSVNEAYEQILSKSKERKLAQIILSIIIAAKRPLTVPEMNVAFALARDGSCKSYEALDRSPDKVFKTTVKQICGLLVGIYDEKVYLLHQTAREFLICRPGFYKSGWQYSVSLEDAHSIIFHVCVHLLCFSEFDCPPWGNRTNGGTLFYEKFKKWIDSSLLLRYAAEHWMEHQRLIPEGSDSDLVENGLKLCDGSSTSIETWLPFWGNMVWHVERPLSDLGIACRIGWYAVVKRILDNGADVNGGAHYGEPLRTACRYDSNEAMVKLLLDRGAHVNAVGKWSRNALYEACETGAVGIVQVLLDNGANINAIDDCYGTPLQVACAYRHEALVRLLLERGADINATGGFYGTALQAACQEGGEIVTRLLLERGADVKAAGGAHGTALHAACAQGMVETVELLLEQGADISCEAYCTVWGDCLMMKPIHAASASGYKGTVELLLERGVDVNARTENFVTPLMVTARFGKGYVVQFLASKGADVCAIGGYYINALLWAAHKKKRRTIRLLFRNGARFDRQDWEGLEDRHPCRLRGLNKAYDESRGRDMKETIRILCRTKLFDDDGGDSEYENSEDEESEDEDSEDEDSEDEDSEDEDSEDREGKGRIVCG